MKKRVTKRQLTRGEGLGGCHLVLKLRKEGRLTRAVCDLNSRSSAIKYAVTFQHWKTSRTDEYSCLEIRNKKRK